MKKLLLTLIASLLGTTCYAVSCNDFVGTWKGTVGKATNFTVQNTAANGPASVEFNANSKRGLTMRFLRCRQNGPHQLFIDYRYDYTTISASLTIMVGVDTAESLDTVSTYFIYNSWGTHINDFGKLTRQAA